MKNPLISVIIPAYNEEKYIVTCLNSVTSQNFPKSLYEIIVVNNNSSDKTKEIVRKNFPKVKIVDEPKQGVVFARIAGVNEAKGEFIVFTDADSCVSKTWLQNIYLEFADPQVVAVGGLIEYFPKFLGSRIKQFISNFSYSFFKSMPGTNMSFKKKSYQAVGGFSPAVNMAEDAYISFKLKKIGQLKILKANKVITSSRRARFFDDILFEVKYLTSVLSFLVIRRNIFFHFKAIRDKCFVNP
ncbi:hypothetical protein COT03_00580 [Candidatus Shapirobacteria bacterium CG07_land_8_20_14_0_80_39_18]|uniref:Glycosyltransferase 2-like domain-containing protein n=1 Tax=Candidatus Shapirobacteria bacterium CG07_land_8_20_14_0_80_39_18 TaxID=1974882 RepID=A0A2M6YRY8_9BACT|nr:MAG: hypothetical protein COT03_00580 [Candidatus Shapirobacteria bacterium CG07_land_8_20_14_0_80_39_18]